MRSCLWSHELPFARRTRTLLIIGPKSRDYHLLNLQSFAKDPDSLFPFYSIEVCIQGLSKLLGKTLRDDSTHQDKQYEMGNLGSQTSSEGDRSHYSLGTEISNDYKKWKTLVDNFKRTIMEAKHVNEFRPDDVLWEKISKGLLKNPDRQLKTSTRGWCIFIITCFL
ncbi:hypothetical protein TNCV_1962501 [Trichonephila clavipes]|nr:hypothetical protein TNCV_1962501 [Trichonephila clavipes]